MALSFLVAALLPAASGLSLVGGRRWLTSFACEMEDLRGLCGGADVNDVEGGRDVHMRYTASPSGVLRYAGARGQPVGDVAELLLQQYDADPEGLRQRAALASRRVAESLASQETRSLRVEQLEAPVDSGSDVGAEQIGRLYYSAIVAAAPSLADLGLPQDVLGFCTLLALSRAAVNTPRPQPGI